jgi:hypothetical protein
MDRKEEGEGWRERRRAGWVVKLVMLAIVV